ncbi:MAG: hypothetical protein LBE04_05115, partial [Prevotellaceae bacterium]|nr:hypothetical protein [Prevotellaceae bacterium]
GICSLSYVGNISYNRIQMCKRFVKIMKSIKWIIQMDLIYCLHYLQVLRTFCCRNVIIARMTYP